MSNLGYTVAAGGSGGGAVSSVAGRAGDVVLAVADVSGAQPKLATQSKVASFTAAAGNIYLVDTTAGAVTATLPSANVAGDEVALKWVAGTNTFTVNRSGSDTIGAATTTANMSLSNEVWELISSGTGQWNLTGGNKTLASLDGRYAANTLTAGQVLPGRNMLHDSLTATNQQVWFCAFIADKTELVSNITVGTRATAAGATPTLCRMGIYSVDGSDNLTFVAGTANDTTLFAAMNTTYTRALTSSFTKQAGQRYATAFLVVSGAAMPAMVGWQLAPTAFVNSVAKAVPAMYTSLSGQTDLPASVAAGLLSGFSGAVGFYLT